MISTTNHGDDDDGDAEAASSPCDSIRSSIDDKSSNAAKSRDFCRSNIWKMLAIDSANDWWQMMLTHVV
jgi:hypothetical protein